MARLSDGTKSGDVHRVRGGHGELIVDLAYSLSIRVSGRAMSELGYLSRRYPLGVGGAVIMAVFVFAAVFAGTVAPLIRSRPTRARPSRRQAAHI